MPNVVKYGLAAVAAVMLAGQAAAADRVVNIYNWSDYIDPSTLAAFTRETGIKVVYDTMDSNDTLETKLYAGNTGYDVVVPSGSNLKREIAAGVLQKLDKSKLPSLKGNWSEVYDRLAIHDPGNQYAVDYMWGTTGIGYNVEKARARLGDMPMNSWDIVFKPENIKKFADCGVYFLDAADELIPAAQLYLGLDPNSKDPRDIARATALLKSVAKNVQKFNSSEYINALANGDICLAVGWSGDIVQAKDRAIEAHKKTPDRALVDIGYAIPKEGAMIWFDAMAIPKDAPHVAEAHAFIDFMNRPEIAARNTNFISYPNGNLESHKDVDPAILKDTTIYPDAQTMKRLFVDSPPSAKIQKLWTRNWTVIKTGQ